jgi:hypothetical protein
MEDTMPTYKKEDGIYTNGAKSTIYVTYHIKALSQDLIIDGADEGEYKVLVTPEEDHTFKLLEDRRLYIKSGSAEITPPVGQVRIEA